MVNITERIIENIDDVNFYDLFLKQKDDVINHKIGNLIGSGTYGQVFEYDDNKVIKIQLLNHNDKLRLVEKTGNIVLLNDKSILETLIMGTLSSSIIPIVYDFGYYEDDFNSFSYIIMSKIDGIEYRKYIREKNVNFHLDYYLKIWLNLLINLKSFWEKYNFVHGDLNTFNMYVYNNNINLIDFGRSSIKINNFYFISKYTYKDINIPNCCFDVCRILQYYNQFGRVFGDEFESLLDNCKGRRGNERPPVVHSCSKELDYEKAIEEVRIQIRE